MRLEARAVRDIKAIEQYIGHGVKIRKVETHKLKERWAAAYWRDRKISIQVDLMFTDDQLLDVMAHECVHALFRQRNLLEHSPEISEYQHLVHETAASVLGAHIAGAVRTRRGGDGEALTKTMLADYRMACDNFRSADMISRLYDLYELADASFDQPKRPFWTGGYFGTIPLIDAIDRICREHTDPYQAAHIIATTLHNVDEKTARKFPIARDWRPRR